MSEDTNSIYINTNPPSEAFSEADKEFLAKEEEANQPEKILGKFDTQDDLVKGYQELEKKLHSREEPQEVKLPSEEQPKAEEEKEEVNEAPANKDVEAAYNELLAAGELNDDVIAKFENAGIPKAMVERIYQLEQQAVQADMNTVVESVGGNENYESLQKWASDNLSKEEISTFNNIIDNGKIDEIKFAVTNLDARMKSSGQQSNLIKADAISKTQSGYESHAQMIHDMRDPRYESDPAYRAAVARKAEKSNF